MAHYTSNPAADALADDITFTALQGAWISHHLRNALCAATSELKADREKSYARCVDICNTVDRHTRWSQKEPG